MMILFPRKGNRVKTQSGPVSLKRGITALIAVMLIGALLCPQPLSAQAAKPSHTFEIGTNDFLLDGKPFQIRCGELHFARIPREYWQHRLQLCKAMGLNTVCAYLFWNYHEFEQGKFDWSGQADVAEFCRLAQAEGLWVILRPGPYSCAEWDGGGIPWWLLKSDKDFLRTLDPAFMEPAHRWLNEVGRVLGPLQVSKGGPILMVQVENEYGFYGNDTNYMRQLADDIKAAGFDVPLFACNPVHVMRKGMVKELFQVANFGKDPKGNFEKLRAIQREGPLMCGEFYPGWFDTWGNTHRTGNTENYIADLDYMLKNNGSFSIYMAHGGTSFGLWAGCDSSKADTTSYDYDAPIGEAGWIGEKFQRTRELMKKYLLPGESLPEPLPANPVMKLPRFELKETAAIFDNLPQPLADATPRNMEAYGQGHGCILYRTTLPPGPAGALQAKQVGDFGWVFLDGKPIGLMDRRSRVFSVALPARTAPARLDILVEAMGHINFGHDIHDRKGLIAPVEIKVPKVPATALSDWQVFPLKLDATQLAGLKWKPGQPTAQVTSPAFWRGSFSVDKPADTFLDTRSWGKGVLWVNGHNLGRFWNIGPTQTMYLPAPWLKKGQNEVVVLDLTGPQSPSLEGLDQPILNNVRPQLDFTTQDTTFANMRLKLGKPAFTGSFSPTGEIQEVRFDAPVEGRQFAIESVNAYRNSPHAAIAELDLLGPDGQPLSHATWRVVYVDSQETVAEDGSFQNAIDGQIASGWLTGATGVKAAHPHRLILDLGATTKITGFRYTPRVGDDATTEGRIKDYRIYAGDTLVEKK